jgi:hypothetical protein
MGTRHGTQQGAGARLAFDFIYSSVAYFAAHVGSVWHVRGGFLVLSLRCDQFFVQPLSQATALQESQ